MNKRQIAAIVIVSIAVVVVGLTLGLVFGLRSAASGNSNGGPTTLSVSPPPSGGGGSTQVQAKVVDSLYIGSYVPTSGAASSRLKDDVQFQSGDAYLYTIDTTTMTLDSAATLALPTGLEITEVVVSPSLDVVCVIVSNPGEVLVYNVSSVPYQLIGTVSLGANVFAGDGVMSPDGYWLYVSCINVNQVAQIYLPGIVGSLASPTSAPPVPSPTPVNNVTWLSQGVDRPLFVLLNPVGTLLFTNGGTDEAQLAVYDVSRPAIPVFLGTLVLEPHPPEESDSFVVTSAVITLDNRYLFCCPNGEGGDGPPHTYLYRVDLTTTFPYQVTQSVYNIPAVVTSISLVPETTNLILSVVRGFGHDSNFKILSQDMQAAGPTHDININYTGNLGSTTSDTRYSYILGQGDQTDPASVHVYQGAQAVKTINLPWVPGMVTQAMSSILVFSEGDQ